MKRNRSYIIIGGFNNNNIFNNLYFNVFNSINIDLTFILTKTFGTKDEKFVYC